MIKNYFVFVGMVLALSVLSVPGVAFAVLPNTDTGTTACTMDAKMCPNGTFVGRTGSNCEFVCPLSEAPATNANILKKGMTNDQVKDIQAILKSDSSIYSGPITGYYGGMTETAIKKVQAKYKLPETGILDEATQKVFFPNNTQISLTVVSPNGGETWKAGEMVKILWKTVFGPGTACLPRPACLDSNPRCLLAEPANGWCRTTATSTTATTQAGMSVVGVTSEEKGLKSMPSKEIAPFFPRGTVSLKRDSDPSFTRHIGTVNLYESSKTWVVSAGIPEAKDYRLSISVGGNTPCLYRVENEEIKNKKISDSSVYPCPMMGAGSNMPYPDSLTSDTSDNSFTIMGGGNVVPDDRITNIKRQLLEIQTMLIKIQEQVRMLNEVVSKLGSVSNNL